MISVEPLGQLFQRKKKLYRSTHQRISGQRSFHRTTDYLPSCADHHCKTNIFSYLLIISFGCGVTKWLSWLSRLLAVTGLGFESQPCILGELHASLMPSIAGHKWSGKRILRITVQYQWGVNIHVKANKKLKNYYNLIFLLMWRNGKLTYHHLRHLLLSTLFYTVGKKMLYKIIPQL